MQSATPIITCWGELIWDIFLPDFARALNGGRVLGGSATALAAQLAALGAEVRLVSAVGDDAEGTEALGELTRRRLNVSRVLRSTRSPTALVEVQVQQSGEPQYAAKRRLHWNELDFQPSLTSALVGADALTFGLFAQGSCLDLGMLERVLETERPRWIGCDLNLRRAVPAEDLARVARTADLVKLNQSEYRLAERILAGAEPLAWLLRAGRTRVVALTLGEQGARLVTRDAVITQAARLPEPLVDTVGAGDAFMAGLTLAMLSDLPLRDALSRAMAHAESQLTVRGAMPKLGATDAPG